MDLKYDHMLEARQKRDLLAITEAKTNRRHIATKHCTLVTQGCTLKK